MVRPLASSIADSRFASLCVCVLAGEISDVFDRRDKDVGSWKDLSWIWVFKAEQNWTPLASARQLFTARGRPRLCLMLIFTTRDSFKWLTLWFMSVCTWNKVALVLTWPVSGRLGGQWRHPALVLVLFRTTRAANAGHWSINLKHLALSFNSTQFSKISQQSKLDLVKGKALAMFRHPEFH